MTNNMEKNRVENAKKGFHKRGFISLLTGFSFAVMLITGIVLYFVPQGRIANWTDWRFLWLTKTDWGNIHITSSILFASCAGYHLYLNWKVFVSYLINKALSLKKEQALAVVITLFFIFGTIYYIPPLNYIVEFSDYLKNLWVKKELEPPFGHAEQVSLKMLAKRTNIDLKMTLDELQKKGIKVEGEGQTLSDVAKKNRLSPMKVYEIMAIHTIKTPTNEVVEQGKKSKTIATTTTSQEPAVLKKTYTIDMVEERLAGKGIGKRTLDELCGEFGVSIEDAVMRLKKQGIEIKKGETLKELANRYNITPLEIAKIALAE